MFSKNDKMQKMSQSHNVKNESILTVCHVRSRLLSHGRLQMLRFADVVL